MLNNSEYIQEFKSLQEKTVSATEDLKKTLKTGQTEKEIETNYYEILRDYGFTEHWYPILIYIGEMTGKPITRRVHLPSNDIVLKENDLIFIDCTPMKKTIWTNWSDTFVVGEDDFYNALINDVKKFIGNLADYSLRDAESIGDVYNHGLRILEGRDLEILDPYKDFGHSIFQVPEGQTVEKTPVEERLLINSEHANKPLQGILSIEPQLGRVNPVNGKLYGAKLQRILYF